VGASWLLGVQAFTAVVQLGYAAFTSRHADHAAFGRYAIALSATALLSLIASSGLGVAASRMPETDDSVTRALMGMALLTGVGTAAVLILLAEPWARLWGDPGASLAIRFLGLGLILSPAVGVQAGLMRREGKFKLLATVLITSSVIAMAIGMIAVALRPGAVSLAAMTVSGTFLQFTIFAMTLGRRGLPSPSMRNARSELGFGSKALVGSLILYVGITAPVIAMSRAIGVATIGEWNRATVLGYVPLQMATSSAQQALYPEFRSAAENRARTREVWSRLFGLSVMLVWPITAAALPWFPFVTRVLLGPDWVLAGSMAQWLLAATAVYFPLAILWAAQESAAMFKEIWRGLAMYSLIMLVAAGSVLLTHDWTSVAIGMVLASGITLCLNLSMLARARLLESRSAVRDLGQAIAASTLLGLSSAVLSLYLEIPVLGLVLSLLATMLLYLRILRNPGVASLFSAIRNAG
jgi:O-antigen/teichoic acid export membrane protein